MIKKYVCKMIKVAMVPSLIITILSISGVAAYFLGEELVVNRVTVGNNESSIEEVWVPPGYLAEGCDYEKGVYVKNSGLSDCYVRVFAETASPKTRNSVIIDYNLEQWRKSDDGYYYYKNVLHPGEKTPHLFTKVHACEDIFDFELIVYEETVQSEGFASAETAFEAICRK